VHDVIVVGARCAGSPVAMLLARRGLGVLLLDRDTFPSDQPMSTHFVHPRGVACLARWGLRDRLVATGAPPVTRSELDFGTVTLAGEAPPTDGESAGFAPRRVLLDDILVRAAVANGAELREGIAVDGLEFDAGRVSGVRGTTAAGVRFSESARLVIGADGPASRVASAVRAQEYQQRPALQGTAWIYWEGRAVDGLELHQRDFEAVYAFPTSGSATLVGANWSMDRFRAARARIEPSYFEVLARAAPRLSDKLAGARRAEERIHLGSTRNFFRKAHGPGWVLLGDAHYKKDPCTAQGITDAFCDAETLAEAVASGLGGSSDLDTGLAEHEQACVTRAMPFYEFTCQLATFAPPPPELRALLAALPGNATEIGRFIGLITEATSPADFFSPESVQRILQARA
jgi:flavin-dependent dehydrogenase